MQGSNNGEFSTPLRGVEEKDIAETGIKAGEESQYRQEEEQEDSEENLRQSLDHLQEEIRKREARLRQIALQKQRHDENSEDFNQLESERHTLRKDVVDLDYDHSRICKRYKQKRLETARKLKEESARKLEEEIQEIQRAREEQRLERSRRLEQQLEEINQASKKRREEIQRIYQQPKEETAQEETAQPQEAEAAEQQSGEQIEPADLKEKSEEEKLAEAKYKARVAEIELQLASERLRRSRQVQLQSELVRIRSYSPYFWWRSYGFPLYPLYPYSLRYVPLYDPLFYPRYLPYSLYY